MAVAVTFADRLYSLLPPSYRDNDEELVLYHYLQGLGDAACEFYHNAIVFNESFIDPDTAPLEFLPWIAAWFNFDLLHWRGLLGWNEEKQRNIVKYLPKKQYELGTKAGIKWFIEYFIDGALVIDIFEPWKKLTVISSGAKISGDTKIRNGSYWRDCVIRVSVTNAGEHVLELLNWIVDARVKVVVDHIQAVQLDIGMDCDINMFTELESHAFQKHHDLLIVSGRPGISMNKYISGLTTICWSGNPIENRSYQAFWPPLANSIWRIDELATRTELLTEKIIVSGEGNLSSSHSLGGSRQVIYSTPIIEDGWDYFGDIENKEG